MKIRLPTTVRIGRRDKAARIDGHPQPIHRRQRRQYSYREERSLMTTILLLLMILLGSPSFLSCSILPLASAFVPPSTTTSSSSSSGRRRPSTLAPRPSDDTTVVSSSLTVLFGIPKMFRWLTDQYPDVLNRQVAEGQLTAQDLQVDNFYLDMNGIIHPATHGNNKDSQIVVLDETTMFKKIFLYVDRIYKLVRPSKILYLAVDGVAPRAKMNQQRSRRFRSAKEAEQATAELLARSQAPQQPSASNEAASYKKAKASSSPTMEELLQQNAKRFDSNCITPGTDFMLKLSLALQQWVQYKMETDPFWKDGADVIVSGPDVPGEGEHKVMDFIRDTRDYYRHQQQHGNDDGTSTLVDTSSHGEILRTGTKDKPYWSPGCTHVLYGLDADLIMLGLVTHESNFLLLREKMSVVMAGRGGGYGRNRRNPSKPKDMLEYTASDFEVLELNSFRRMLSIQFRKFADSGRLKVPYDLNRIVDDFVFMCMMVGNDFLPHCPHLEIDSGAISLMMSTYIELLPEWGGYLTKKERIHPERFEEFMYQLSVFEEEHFKRRGYEENEPGWKLSSEEEQEPDDFYGKYYSGDPTPAAAVGANRKDGGEPPDAEERPMAPTGNRAFRRRHPDSTSRSYRDFYYETKMGWKPSDRSRTLFRRREHVREYIEGLHWVLNYYHNGCQSWDWFFPYLYSPLATDIVNLSEFYDDVDEEGFGTFPFEPGTPFPSLAQLLSVLPPQSADLLPKPLAELMLHPSSPLTSYYPPDFTTDPNGKRQPWEAVVQIPFIEAGILLDTVDRILDMDSKGDKPLLTNAERRRNVPGKVHCFQAPGLSEEEREQLQRRPEPAVAKRKPRSDTSTRKRTTTTAGARGGARKASRPRSKE